MRKITKRLKPHIIFHTSGLIEILSEASRFLGLTKESSLSFIVDDDRNLFIKKDPEGFLPSSIKGAYYRYHSAEVSKSVFNLPDIKNSPTKISFRFGEEENGLIPIITRREIRKD